MIVVSDASPLVGLAAIGRFELLRELYGEIFIPPTVFKELTQKGRGRPGDREVREAAWVIEKACTDQELFRTLRTRLDPGEAEAITLALDLMVFGFTRTCTKKSSCCAKNKRTLR